MTLKRFTPLSVEEKDRIYQEIIAECELQHGNHWVWRGAKSPSGYGMKYIQGKMRPVGRFMLCYATRESLDFKADACHNEEVCDLRSCINPDHLRWGSHADNCAEKEAIQFRFGANARKSVRRARRYSVPSEIRAEEPEAFA